MSFGSFGLGRIINRFLRPIGIRIQKCDPRAPKKQKVPLWLYERILREFHNYLIETVFPSLPATKGRLDLLGQLEGLSVQEALWLLDALHSSLKVNGCVCEFGVAAGATSALIANEIRSTDKTLWLFDSFQGLPKPTQKDLLLDDIMGLESIEAYEGRMRRSPEMVKSKLQSINFPESRVEIVPGYIENTLKSERVPLKVCFAFVDVDFYVPILTALSFLHERISVGGRILVDDYGEFSSGAKTAVDEFIDVHSDLFAINLPPERAGHFAILERLSI